MNRSWLGCRTGSSGVRSSPATAVDGAAIGASNREGAGSIVISLTPQLLSSFHIRKRIIVNSDSPPRYRHFDYAWRGRAYRQSGFTLSSLWIRFFVRADSPRVTKAPINPLFRSEERRVGEEGVSMC